ncbi:YjiH family protein [Tuberibacillus sp. Marseille-P3662]|uniref:YjiH family protein n=1 Tax=Tuberibacillus sp. Marseille-P3662 TaxID=1965358 RepID=UPI0020CAEC1F|nr:YjiH family protein [Tuberibacillus sp. Marseille-P3662]
MEKLSSYRLGTYLKFIIPSIIGVFLFMIPVQYTDPSTGEDATTIPIAYLADLLKGEIVQSIPYIVTVIITITALMTLLTKLVHPRGIIERPFLNALFNANWFWTAVRILGCIFAIMVAFNIGPEAVTSMATGGLLLDAQEGLLSVLFVVFLFAGLFLPLLLDFGLLDLFGTLMTKIMRPLFTLPGRSAIDCLASWLGDGTIGVLLTNKQYDDGYYTKREAAVIGTTFSVVSITFSIVVLETMDLTSYMLPYYLTIVVAGVVAALIMPRIPPLSRKDNSYSEQQDQSSMSEEIPEGQSVFKFGLLKAAKQSSQTRLTDVAKSGVQNVIDMWFAVMPIVMAIGTGALIIAEETPIFDWLGLPFIPLLELMQIPEAAEASKTILVGFTDMFTPALIGANIESELTRFVIACLSVTQLIYMSEVGGLLLGSKLPIKFRDLVIIFLERTVITLPIIVIMAHIIF